MILSPRDLGYLAGLARRDVRVKERALTRFQPRPGQTAAEAAAVHAEFAAHLERHRALLARLDAELRA